MLFSLSKPTVEQSSNQGETMKRKAPFFILAAIALILFTITKCSAQDSIGQAISVINRIEASGTFAPKGPPLETPVRISAGGSCIVDIRQAYTISGTLSGSLEIDYRIIVFDPCEVPPVLGKYNESWIAYGTFTGTMIGSSTSGTLTYIAHVKAGGDVEGQMVFDDGLSGEISVKGNFSDGKLSYKGLLK